MRILVVCGAGASSTFVAQRLNRALQDEGIPHEVEAATSSSLLRSPEKADIVLLGPHMAETAQDVRGRTGPESTSVALLPQDIHHDLDGRRALAVLREALVEPAEKGTPMSASRTVVVASSHGLHARPAKLFVQAAQDSGASVTLTKGEKSVNAASILTVLSLGVERGDEVTLSAEGENAEQALDSLEEFLTTDHDEAS